LGGEFRKGGAPPPEELKRAWEVESPSRHFEEKRCSGLHIIEKRRNFSENKCFQVRGSRAFPGKEHIHNKMEKKKELEKTPLWEDIAVIVSVLTLWPTVLRRENLMSRILMVIALLILVFILLRRLKRFNSALNK